MTACRFPHPLRAISATSAAILALAAASAMAQDLKPLTVVLSYVPNVENFGALYAKEMGFFEQAGLDVTLIPGGQGIDQIQMVSAGMAQLGMTGADSVVAAVDKGADLKVIAAQFQTSPVAMTCREDSGITEPSMIAGKRLGVKQAAQVYAESFLAKNDVDIADVETTTIGNSDVSTIIAGAVDCMITTFAVNEPRLIENAGVPVTVLPLGDWGMNSQSGSWIVTGEFLSDPENAQTLVAYLEAEARAWDVYFDDPEAAAQFIVEGNFNDGLDLDQQTYQAVHQADYMLSDLTAENGILWLDPDVWDETVQNAFEAGAASSVIDPESFTTTEILEAAQLPMR
ncbi:ABC transporter substrate-binding protein [Pelagibacterium halotolerans]|uniref:Thiamine pyrimidine synthase n=1 Tax=Pelagibacterium halotolerans (strain DSM 22347 / JCM 15775 / CGMCC 1.7692 / B2) TaxID=1082931 RepID=G4REP5_PELHB|nr:ABC transporter substrate-binding protein [Pelagibacterium halotolerans]AEQ50895.1 GGDEF domain protein [Pelagibacterium halotolerans B2]QJR19201.1 ABC transporter substrate-binding protein [Pelagibacterium halotolerans]SDZ99243.1 ABC-type nitrate/sulfonate/bicarbonate transport system, substrate-binding protein [Pelagibacterium halotolerans]